ncbi:AAA family ATPase [Streptomyces durbertensis]|uniref:AAA family ATPase n=1 Tax=Streptomyces durbertensis TaxID=2448886 RepID=A0ABR6EBS8_9ACTN|nr:LuxR family transcriptional regulator [Streptomyces durbertensis]MBB1242623.1 AAA family ATPase [Streptomyces durbertensis]
MSPRSGTGAAAPARPGDGRGGGAGDASTAEGDGCLLLRAEESRLLRAWTSPCEAGASVLLRGTSGTGKSTLLRTYVAGARRAGDPVFLVCADPPDATREYGVVEQLLARLEQPPGEPPPMAARVAALREVRAAFTRLVREDGDLPTATTDAYRALCGLLTRLARARGRRLVIAVDDLHWADASSLRFLRYLLRRLDRIPAAVVATLGDAEPSVDERRAGFLFPLFLRQLTLRPVTEQEVAELAELVVGAPVDEVFVRACHSVTGGNPYLLHAVLRSLAGVGLAPDARTAAEITRHLPDEVSRAVRARIRHAGPDALALAHGLAVLSGTPAVPVLAETAGLSEPAAEDASHLLEGLGLIRRLKGTRVAFSCPAFEAAVHDGMLPSARNDLHARAAEVLRGRGAAWDAVVRHLLHTPSGTPWLVDALRRAALEAAGRGDAEQASRCLRRVLFEDLSEQVRAAVLVELGTAELDRSVPEASLTLRRAFDLARTHDQRAAAARVLSVALCALDRHDEAAGLLADVLDHRPAGARRDPELELGLCYARWCAEGLSSRVLRGLARVERAARREPSAPRPLTALRATLSAVPSEAVTGPAPRRDVRPGVSWTRVLCRAAALLAAPATVHLPDDVAPPTDLAVRTRASLGGRSLDAALLAARAVAHLARGRLAEADADAGAALAEFTALEVGAQHGWPTVAVSVTVEVSLARGRLEEAERLLVAHRLTGGLGVTGLTDRLLLARGRLNLAAGRAREALADFLAVGEREGGPNRPAAHRPAWPSSPWRADAALAHLALDDTRAAAALVTAEIEQTSGAPDAVRKGLALRARGLVFGGARGLASLRQACELLVTTPARLEEARALADLGAAERLLGDHRAAGAALRRAATLAESCGATPLVDRCLDELRAAGHRPRSRTFAGVAALTPAERRVAELAARGLTNRQLAAYLHVGRRTVELHLSAVYDKLGIPGRSGLATALAEPTLGAFSAVVTGHSGERPDPAT